MSYEDYNFDEATEAAIDVHNDNEGNFVCWFGDNSASVFTNGILIHHWVICPDGSPSELTQMAWVAHANNTL